MTSTNGRIARHRSGGPRPDISAPPLDLSGLGSTRGSASGPVHRGPDDPVRQGCPEAVPPAPVPDGDHPPGAPRHPHGRRGHPQGNGKSSLAAALGLWALVDGDEGAQVPIVGGVAERQAEICFNIARRMVELSPELSERVQIFQRRLYMPHHDASMFPLPADADALLGANPTFTLVDETRGRDRGSLRSYAPGVGEAVGEHPVGDRYPPREPDSIMRTLVEHGRRGADPAFALVEYRAPSSSAVDDRKAWRKANPTLGDFLYEDGMATEAKTVRESTFRQFRLGQWIAQSDEAWMASALWASCVSPMGDIPDGADVVLALDGSFSQDCTAVVGCWLSNTDTEASEKPHLFVVGCWQNPNPGDDTFRIDVSYHPRRVPPVQRARGDRRPLPLDPHPPSAAGPADSRLRVPAVTVEDDAGDHGALRGRHQPHGDTRPRQDARPARRERRVEGRQSGHEDREGAQGLTGADRLGGGGRAWPTTGPGGTPASRGPAIFVLDG